MKNKSKHTVHRNEIGNTIAPTSGSDNTKLDSPNTDVVPFPNEHPVKTFESGVTIVWYSFKHNRNIVEHGGQPETDNK